jgi:hypothetical protein
MEIQIEDLLDKLKTQSNELNIQYQSMIDSCKEIENIIDDLSQDIYKLGEELK